MVNNRYFIDTNILLDLLSSERKFSRISKETVTRLLEQWCVLYMSAMSVNNINYIERKTLSRETFQRFYGFLVRNFVICDLTEDVLTDAVSEYQKDFEDEIQLQTAYLMWCEYIVTNDAKDFKHSQIAVVTPEEMLTRGLF